MARLRARGQHRFVSVEATVPFGRARAEAVARLSESVEAFARALESMSETPLTGGEWGPREMLCHLVFWHETYLRIAHAINTGQDRVPLVGTFPEFNRRSVVELGHEPVTVLVARLRRAQRRFAAELLAMNPHSRITIKVGAQGRGPLEFALRTDAHLRGHLTYVRRYRRRLLGPGDASVDDQT
jgi:mycothiol maleylpyruvate isomerase-like protein